MAAVQFALKKYPEAQKTYETALEIRQSVLPADHADLAVNMYQLAAVLRCQNKFEEATAMGTDALTRLKRRHGTEHPTTAAAMNALALTYKARAGTMSVLHILLVSLGIFSSFYLNTYAFLYQWRWVLMIPVKNSYLNLQKIYLRQHVPLGTTTMASSTPIMCQPVIICQSCTD
jgi:hypothetical protein